jgi:hypothetical protein
MAKKKKALREKPKPKEERPMTPEEEKARREQLIKGYEGQVEYCYRRIEREKRKLARKKNEPRYPKIRANIEHYTKLAEAWKERIELCRSGAPFEQFLKKKVLKGE